MVESRVMRRAIESMAIVAAALLLGITTRVRAQDSTPTSTPARSGEAKVVVPESSVEHPGDVGVRAHTNYEILVPSGGFRTQPTPGSPRAGGGQGKVAPGTGASVDNGEAGK